MTDKYEHVCRNHECAQKSVINDEVFMECPLCGEPMRAYPIVACACGREVYCTSSWANGCDCGREYNGSGQELADRRFWGEETGESFSNYREEN